jgi:hypothetical protein
MLSPQTAQPGHSVWDGVKRETFETHADALCRTGLVPEPCHTLEQDWPEKRREDLLPFGIEQQLSDDFAFISACEYGVGYVTVATIAPAAGGAGGLTLRLAANEGISDRVIVAITGVLEVLKRCATKGTGAASSYRVRH